jgi:glyceraldehyde-3-phosphate dehydrogenase/erythrose-4-phosphate dehydrogenase
MVRVTIKVIIEKTLRVRVSIQVVTMTIISHATEQYTPSRGTDGRDTNWRRRRGTSMPTIKSRQGILERLSLIIDQVVSRLSTMSLAASTASEALWVS